MRYTSYPDPVPTDFYQRTGDTGVGDIPPVRSGRGRNRWQASRETEDWRQEPDGGARYGRVSESLSYDDSPEPAARPSWADRRYDTGSWRNVSDTASWRRGAPVEPEDRGYRAYQPGGRYGSRPDPVEPDPEPRRPPDDTGGSWRRDAEEDTWNRRSSAGSWRRVTETRTWVSETGSWDQSELPAPREPRGDAWSGRATREDTGTWQAARPTRSERRARERAEEERAAADGSRPAQRSDWPDWSDPTMGPARTRGMRPASATPPVPRSGNAPALPPEAVQERPSPAADWPAGSTGTTDTGTWRRRPQNADDGAWRGPQSVSDTGTWRRGPQLDDPSPTTDTGTRAGGYGFTRAEPGAGRPPRYADDEPRPRYADERRTTTDTSSWRRTPDGVMWTGAPATGEMPAPRVYRAARPVRPWDDASAAERDWASGQANTGTYPDGLTRPSYADTEAPPEQRAPRREMSPAMRRRVAVEELEELEEAPPGGPLAAIGFTVFWYAVPVVFYTIYTLTQGAAERARGSATLLDAAPQFGISLALSIVIAYLLRLVSGTWKTASVGLAAAVMGGGLATVLVSAISGQPIG